MSLLMDDCQLCSLWGEEKTRDSSGDTGENMMVEGEGERLCFFFCVWGWGGCAQWCSPCDVLFLDEELQLLGVEIREWKVSDGGRDWGQRRKAKKSLKGGGGWYRVRRPLCFIYLFFFVFSSPFFLLFFSVMSFSLGFLPLPFLSPGCPSLMPLRWNINILCNCRNRSWNGQRTVYPRNGSVFNSNCYFWCGPWSLELFVSKLLVKLSQDPCISAHFTKQSLVSERIHSALNWLFKLWYFFN